MFPWTAISLLMFFLLGCQNKHQDKEINQTKSSSYKLEQKAPIMIEEGLASYYANKFHGKPTASGELYDKEGLSAAHKTLPFGTMVKVTRIDNGNNVMVRINDRMPKSNKRSIDLSFKAAQEIDLIYVGIGKVSLEILSK